MTLVFVENRMADPKPQERQPDATKTGKVPNIPSVPNIPPPPPPERK